MLLQKQREEENAKKVEKLQPIEIKVEVADDNVIRL